VQSHGGTRPHRLQRPGSGAGRCRRRFSLTERRCKLLGSRWRCRWWCLGGALATPGLAVAAAGGGAEVKGIRDNRSARPDRLGNAARDLRPRF
jgi:hypothetical protein